MSKISCGSGNISISCCSSEGDDLAQGVDPRKIAALYGVYVEYLGNIPQSPPIESKLLPCPEACLRYGSDRVSLFKMIPCNMQDPGWALSGRGR